MELSSIADESVMNKFKPKQMRNISRVFLSFGILHVLIGVSSILLGILGVYWRHHGCRYGSPIWGGLIFVSLGSTLIAVSIRYALEPMAIRLALFLMCISSPANFFIIIIAVYDNCNSMNLPSDETFSTCQVAFGFAEIFILFSSASSLLLYSYCCIKEPPEVPPRLSVLRHVSYYATRPACSPPMRNKATGRNDHPSKQGIELQETLSTSYIAIEEAIVECDEDGVIYEEIPRYPEKYDGSDPSETTYSRPPSERTIYISNYKL